ncbi:hypothetical protein ACB098_01G089800 [Castanea mollissima]
MALNGDNVTECKATKPVPNCGVFSWAFTQTPLAVAPQFLRPFNSNSKPSSSNYVCPNPNTFLRDIQSSIMSTTDKCFKLLHLFASENPVLKKLLAWSSEFHTIRKQIDCRNYRNMSSLSNHNFAAVLPGDSVAGLVVANGILNFLNIYNTVLIVRLVLTWFPNAPSVIVSPLSTLCDPYLNIFRGIIPPLGGLDLSPILAFLVLNAFTSTASALPAELPGTRTSEEGPASHSKFTNLTTSQKKWLLRLQGNRSKSSSGVN